MNADLKKIKGVYVHIPFCAGKCFYCAFYSRPYESGLIQRYLRALEMELKEYPRPNVETIYFGGGTPSLLFLSELEILCNLIKENISTAALKEWTVEINPGSLTTEKLALLAKTGVNRISLGAQSFDDNVLKWLGRRHNVADIYEAARMIKSAGFDNFGVDLIACIPGFKPDIWRKTLEAAIALEPKHISVYALTNEEGSRLAQAVDGRQNKPPKTATFPQIGRDSLVPPCFCRSDGLPAVLRSAMQAGRPGSPALPSATLMHQVNLLSEDEEIESLIAAANILADAGYRRYEISNYAQPGFECLHNLSCWRGEEYIGLGPAAASHAGLKRWTNLPDLGKYLETIEHGEKPLRTIDILNKRLKQMEKIVFGLRMSEGISETTASICEKILRDLGEQGLVLNAEGRWRLTERGFYLADYVGAELLAAAG